jgi:hypothetical protein
MFFQIRTIAYLRKTGYELEAAQTTFRLGPRVGLGEDIAMMEMYKLLPEVILSSGL